MGSTKVWLSGNREAVARSRAGSRALREWLKTHRPHPRQQELFVSSQEEDDLL